MIKLNLTHEFSGRDIRDAAAPDIIYRAYIHWSFDARDKALSFIRDGIKDTQQALEALSLLLVSITHDDQIYPVNLEWLKEYKDDIEEQNAGMSDWYICQLARDIINYQWNFTDKRLKNSQRPLTVSENGNGQKKEKSPVKV